MSQPNIFISHTTQDNRDDALAKYLAKGLQALGANVLIAPDDIPAGSEWEQRLETAILEECSHFLVILSAASIVSKWVLKEIEWAQERKEGDNSFEILPLRVGQVGDFSGNNFISKYQNVDYHDESSAILEEIAKTLDLSPINIERTANSDVRKQIRKFRSERLEIIKAGKTSVEMIPINAKIVLHILPFSAFTKKIELDYASFISKVIPIRGVKNKSRYNYDGYLSTYANPGEAANSYVQFYKNGCFEAVETDLLNNKVNGKWVIPGHEFERIIYEATKKYTELLVGVGISHPVYLMLSLVGVKGYYMYGPIDSRSSFAIDRDDIISEAVVDQLDIHPAEMLHPIFNAVWRASGNPGSPYYDDTGNWKIK